MERAVALCRAELVEAGDLPLRVRVQTVPDVALTDTPSDEWLSLDEIEKRYVLDVLNAVDGNKSSAAQLLGLSRKTLYRRLRIYGLMGDEKEAS